MKKDDGGPAYPAHEVRCSMCGTGPTERYPGMTLRDYFAGQALAGFVSNDKNYLAFNAEDDATYCYRLADAMLAERNKGEER